MDKKIIDNKINSIIELKKQKKELETAIACLVDSLKDEMDMQGIEQLDGDKLYCYYKDIKKTVTDTEKLKADNLFHKYSKITEYKLFDYQAIK